MECRKWRKKKCPNLKMGTSGSITFSRLKEIARNNEGKLQTGVLRLLGRRSVLHCASLPVILHYYRIVEMSGL